MKEGYNCSCGTYNEFSSYVFAHWSQVVKGKCKECGREAAIHRGKVLSTSPKVNVEMIENWVEEALGV